MKFSYLLLPAVAYATTLSQLQADPSDLTPLQKDRYANSHNAHNGQQTYSDGPNGVPRIGGHPSGWENTDGGLPRYPGMPAFRNQAPPKENEEKKQ